MKTRIAESAILSEVLVAVSALPYGMFWRNNTGSLPGANGRWIRFGVVGSPDILGCYHGQFVGIEVKNATGALSMPQKRFRETLERAGGIYIVARSPAEAVAALAARIAF